MESDEIEDSFLDFEEVNESFKRGVRKDGRRFLERAQKQAMADSDLEHVHNIKKVFAKLHHYADNSNKITSKTNIIDDFERFGLGTDTIMKLGTIFVTIDAQMPDVPARPKYQRQESEETCSYEEDDFEDYESEFEEEDMKVADARQFDEPSITVMKKTPTFLDVEPVVAPRATRPLSISTAASTAKRSSQNRRKSVSWIRKGQWRLGEKIGSGSFGEVFQCMNDEGLLFAVKRLNMTSNPADISNLTSEIELMQCLSHPNIVMYLGAHVEEETGMVYIFQEWIPGGSVAQLLKRFGPFQIGVVRTYTRQILLGLEYLHANGIVHRDIKGGNVLVDDIGTVKLADFGASTRIELGETQESPTIKGTPYFMAPEVLSQSKYGRRGDIWAVGCTIIQMLTGDPPWKDRKLQSLVQLHVLLQQWEGVPPVNRELPQDLADLLFQCFAKDPQNRPMAIDLLNHPFLYMSDDELSESLGAPKPDIRTQLERVAARNSVMQGDDTFGAIESAIRQRDQRNSNRRESVEALQQQLPARRSGGGWIKNEKAPDSSISDLSPNRSDSEPVTPSTPNPFARQSPSSASASESNSQNPFGRLRNSVVGSAVPTTAVPEGIANSTKNRLPSRGHKRVTSNDSGIGSDASSVHGNGSGTETRQSKMGHARSNSMQQESARDGIDDDITPRVSIPEHANRPIYQQSRATHRPLRAMAQSSSTTAIQPQRQRSAPSSSVKSSPLRSSIQGPSGYVQSPPVVSPYDIAEGDDEYEDGDAAWTCLKCGFVNEGIDYCDACATVKGSTGARGNNAILPRRIPHSR